MTSKMSLPPVYFIGILDTRGLLNGTTTVARAMLASGMEVEQISALTGLSVEEIEEL